MSIIQKRSKQPLLIFEFPLFKKATKEKILKMVPKELQENLEEVLIEKGKISISFSIETFEHPTFNFGTNEFRVKNCLNLETYSFEKELYPFVKKMFANNDGNPISGCIRMGYLTGYYVLSNIEMSPMAADRYSRFYELDELTEEKMETVWFNFIKSIEELGSTKEDVED